jgi:tRNA threonylcarbamoyl adenosine modification protein YeaZ
MIGLTLDTSHLYASIAISKNDKVMYFKNNKKVNKQAETLNLMIEEAMSDLRLSFSDLNYIAVATGPGKFTGLRIGICVGNALHFALKAPLLPMCNLATIAFNHKEKNVGVLLDAGVEKYYFQEFNNKINTSPIKIITKDEISEIKKELYLVGNVDQVNDKFLLDARHIAKFANHKLKNLKNLVSNYLKPQYIINNYLA